MKRLFWLSAASILTFCTISLAQAPEPTTTPAAPPAFTAELLDGKSITGATVKQLTKTTLELESPDGALSVSVRDVEQLRRADAPALPDLRPAIEITLQDGSILGGTAIQIAKRAATFESPLGRMTLPATALKSVRLAPAEDALNEAWTSMQARQAKDDLLIVKKGMTLDFVAGVVGDITEKEVTLLVKNRGAAVPRERVFGVVYVAQPQETAPVCEVQLDNGDRVRASEAELIGDALSVPIGSASVKIPLAQVTAIDFTLGRVKALSDLPLTQTQTAKSPLLGASVFDIRKNRTSVGETLRVGRREFKRGLWIHSGVSASFRLGREYRKLTAQMGIDSNSIELPRIAPRVKVKILGDSRELYSGEIAWDAPAVPLDVDVTGVRELEIRVDPGREMPGVLEHLVLGDARVIK